MCIVIKNKPILYSFHSEGHKLVNFYFIGPECASCLKRGLRMLSFKSRKLRFNTPIKNFSASQLSYLTNIDNHDHIGIIAEKKLKGTTLGLGVARCKRLPGEPDKAELALTVVDKFQNTGLGTIMLSLLINISSEKGIDGFYSHINKDNTGMIKLIKKFGSTILKQDYNEALFYTDLNQASGQTGQFLNKEQLI